MCGTPRLRGTFAEDGVAFDVEAGEGAIVELGVVGAEDGGEAGDSMAAVSGVTFGGERWRISPSDTDMVATLEGSAVVVAEGDADSDI